MTVKERLLEYLRYHRISQLEFARRMEVSPAYVGAMRRSMSDDKIMRLRREFPDLNTDWLLYGEGKMLLPVAHSGYGNSPLPAEQGRGGVGSGLQVLGSGYNGQGTEDEDPGKGYEVPLLPVAAYAGNLQLWSQGVSLRDCEKVISPIRGADFAIRVSGDSMEPDLHDGATILIKRINEKAFIPWGNKMVIDTENGVLVKEVYPVANDRRKIEARSLNPKYPPIEIPAESIYGLYRVLGQVQVYTTF